MRLLKLIVDILLNLSQFSIPVEQIEINCCRKLKWPQQKKRLDYVSLELGCILNLSRKIANRDIFS